MTLTRLLRTFLSAPLQQRQKATIPQLPATLCPELGPSKASLQHRRGVLFATQLQQRQRVTVPQLSAALYPELGPSNAFLQPSRGAFWQDKTPRRQSRAPTLYRQAPLPMFQRSSSSWQSSSLTKESLVLPIRTRTSTKYHVV